MNNSLFLVAVIAIVIATTSPSAAADLTITAPLDGTTVTQGTTLTVTVQNANPQVNQVLLAGSLVSEAGATVATTLQNASPSMTFQLAIPSTMRPGSYKLGVVDASSAQALTRAGSFAGPIRIVVAPAMKISGLIAQPSQMTLRYVGDTSPLRIIGNANGQYSELTESPSTAFKSSDTTIAKVDSAGRVIGMGAGTAIITATYGGLTVSVQVVVPSNVRGDLDGNGRVDQYDLALLVTRLDISATGPSDARDLNRDGRIDALDARILTTLCTYSRCATHP